MKTEDFFMVLPPMRSGVIVRPKREMRDVKRMITWVSACCNRWDMLPP